MRFTNLTRRTEIGANCYLLEIAGRRIVLDSGMHPKQEGDEAQPAFGLIPDDSVDAIILSHAHHDHLGTLPVLMRRQRRAPVFMTEPTRHLSEIMLHNSVNIMTRLRDERGVMHYPLFTHRDLDGLAPRWQTRPVGQPFTLDGERLPHGEEADVSIEFFDAGHILGSVGALIRGEGRTIFYSGDVNFDDQTIMKGAVFPREGVDVLVLETTRGDSPTPEGFSRANESKRLAAAIIAGFDRDGCVLVPLFALGKTQEILVMLHELGKQGLVPTVPLYIGGLSAKLTQVYDKFTNQARRRHPGMQILDVIAPFVLAGRQPGSVPIKPRRIYAMSSGMMTEKTGSNVLARRILEDPQQSICFVGYADPESPAGRVRLAAPGDMVVLDEGLPAQPLKCHVLEFTFSAHATRESIRDYARGLAPKKVLLVHGDPQAVEWFRATLSADLPSSEVVVPPPGESLEL